LNSQPHSAQASRVAPNRSSDPDAIARFYEEAEQILGGSKANTLEAQTIAVLPGHQRGGVGKAFSKWSFDMAEAEGVRAVGDASHKGIGLYLKIGMKIRGTVVMDAKESRLEDTEDVVQLPRVEVPVVEWVPGEFRAI
jgi:GNAT superfamily N-acetyltransferase